MVEAASSSLVTQTISSVHNRFKLWTLDIFSAIFKTTTGRTLSDYYSTRRLEHAKFLILEGNTKVWEIADLLHYSSAFSFSKAFTKKYGISPKKMQKENLNTESKKATD